MKTTDKERMLEKEWHMEQLFKKRNVKNIEKCYSFAMYVLWKFHIVVGLGLMTNPDFPHVSSATIPLKRINKISF
jgi:hypothetical protein